MIEADALREIEDQDWDGSLHSLGLADVYLGRGYARAAAIQEAAEPVLLLHEGAAGGIVFPLLLRRVPDASGCTDVITPHGYGGPIGVGPSPPWTAFRDAYERWCRGRGVVTTFVRFHPRYRNHLHAGPTMEVRSLAGTVGWRIDAGRDLLAQMHSHHRRYARIAEREGVETTCRPADDEGLARFRPLYGATMRRVGASSYYDLPDRYWRRLHDGVGRRLLLAEAYGVDGSLLAAALLFDARPWLHYHLGGSTEEGRRVNATVLLFLEVARRAQADGFEVFHLGGGVGGSEDSLLRWKRRFDAGGVLDAAVGRQVNDPSSYGRLTDGIEASGFFPAYRRRT